MHKLLHKLPHPWPLAYVTHETPTVIRQVTLGHVTPSLACHFNVIPCVGDWGKMVAFDMFMLVPPFFSFYHDDFVCNDKDIECKDI